MTLPDFYVFEINQNTFQYFIDVLIAPSLFAYYWLNTKGKNINLILAFTFLWAGDLLILFEQSDAYLKWGVFCYWVMQLFLIRNFFNYFRGYSFREHLLGILFYGAYLAVFFKSCIRCFRRHAYSWSYLWVYIILFRKFYDYGVVKRL